MDDFMDEEELFEQQCQQELEMMQEIEEQRNELEHGLDTTSTNSSELGIAFGGNYLSQISGPRRILDTPHHGPSSGHSASTPLLAIGKGKHSRLNTMLPIAELETSNLEPNSEVLPSDMEAAQVPQKRKRLERDLFGDLDDLYGDNTEFEETVIKKMKTSEDTDMMLIEKILKSRKELRESNRYVIKDNSERLKMVEEFKRRNLSESVPKWPFIPLTGRGAHRVYVRFHSEEYEHQELNDIKVKCSSNTTNLLGTAKTNIWNEVNALVLKRLNTKAVDTHDSSLVSNQVQRKGGCIYSTLWVDKYKPKKYIDLLSDESTNRDLLCWIKMWDKIVFGREFKQTEDKGSLKNTNNLNTFNKKTGKFESNGGWRSRKAKILVDTNTDELGRPVQKVALLWGPPGLGKTTLAHMIAKQAGYNIRELNASDDRSLEAFKTALEDSTQMSSWSNYDVYDRKPNCIVIDEIDGAPRQSIDYLVKFVTDSVLIRKAKGPAKKAKYHILKRPILCICNDVHSPALRSLRQIALMVEFPPLENERLAVRLSQIAEEEHLKADFGSLLALAEKSGCDVRSCVGTMQFFSASNKPLTLSKVLDINCGTKDRRQGFFDVWKAIFKIERPRQENVSNSEEQITFTNHTLAARFQHILNMVQSTGEYDRLLQGVHENYLQQKMPDPDLKAIMIANQWFCFHDLLQYHVNHMQNYTVYPYLQYSFVKVHQLLGSYSLPKLRFPTKAFEFTQKHNLQLNTCQSLCKSMTAPMLSVCRGKCFLLEIVPLLKRILSPHLRSVAIQLLSAKEREDLTHTVKVMADMGLTYVRSKTTEGTYTFKMEPDLGLLLQLPGFDGVTVSHFGRQLLAREIEIESIHRALPKDTQIPNPSADSLSKRANPTTNNSKVPNHLQRLLPRIPNNAQNKAKETKPSEISVTKDFFGRISYRKATSDNSDRADGNIDPIVKSPIWYRYKEGHNNAVRKDIYIKELI